MKLATLEDLLVDELQDLYSAEKQLIKALPKMAKAATREDLRQAFQEHLQQTQMHLDRLDQVFESMGKRARAKKCPAMEGIVEEGKEIISSGDEASTTDAGLIAAAQKAEHYEIACYGSARTHARALGHQDIADILNTTLQEEGETDKLLTRLAESGINEHSAREASDSPM